MDYIRFMIFQMIKEEKGKMSHTLCKTLSWCHHNRQVLYIHKLTYWCFHRLWTNMMQMWINYKSTSAFSLQQLQKKKKHCLVEDNLHTLSYFADTVWMCYKAHNKTPARRMWLLIYCIIMHEFRIKRSLFRLWTSITDQILPDVCRLPAW